MLMFNYYETLHFIGMILLIICIKKHMMSSNKMRAIEGIICEILYTITMITIVCDIGIDEQGFASVLHCLIWFVSLPILTFIAFIFIFLVYKYKSKKLYAVSNVMICVMVLVCAYLIRHNIAIILGIVSMVAGLVELMIAIKKK